MVDVNMRVVFEKLYHKESIRLKAMLHSALNKLSVNSKSKSSILIVLSINFNLVILLKTVCLPLVEISDRIMVEKVEVGHRSMVLNLCFAVINGKLSGRPIESHYQIIILTTWLPVTPW